VFELHKVIRVGSRLLKVLWPNYELGEAGVRLGKADSVSGKANWVSRVVSGLA
jgi:hypothetical protein